MAIYHFSAKVIGRSAGRSAVASAAYRAAECLHDEKLGRTHDYTDKLDNVHREIMLPEGAATRWQNRSTLWNEVEAGEKRKDAQLARDIEISLPRELGKAEAIRLARDFVREQFVDRGIVADLNVHWTQAADGEAQPHAHVMLTMREIVPGPDGEGAFGKKVVAWNDRALLGTWRERWASLTNERLIELDHDVRIDHRSYAEQGISLEPQNKIGPAGARRAERGEVAERADEHMEIARRNGEAIVAEPELILDALTRQHATFTRRDLARFVSRHTADADQFELAMARAEAAPELVRLGTDGRGQDRFTTREMLEVERRMEAVAAELSSYAMHIVGPERRRAALGAAAQAGVVLGSEQVLAVEHVTRGQELALVVGYAGTGKSTMLGVAREAWEAAGYRVRGAALSGIAAEGLEGGSGIASRTLASLEWAWKEGRDQLTSRDVLVVDEAGMVGSLQMERVLSAARAAGAKVVLVGDPEQLQAIEAGAAFRALAERHGAVEIGAVRRQRVDWQREATRELATARTGAALGRYAAAGMVMAAETREAAKAALVTGWDAARHQSPQASQVILAYTRDDVRALNGLARERMRVSGALRGADQVVTTEFGERVFAAGDRLMFRRNERGLGAGPDRHGGVAVKNGTLGTVLAVEAGGERLTVRLDGAGGPGSSGGAGQAGKDAPSVVTFSTTEYGHVEHGYASTIHKAQGVTVDRVHVLASRHMDRHAAYVALTRHREGVLLYYGQDEFGDGAALARTLGREGLKDSSLDYGGTEPALEAARVWQHAERREFDPLHPASEIVVPMSEPVVGRQPEPPAPRRSKFAGLKLDAGRGAEPPAAQRAPAAVRRVPSEREQLEAMLAAYARTWWDAARMAQAGLPVLAHQAAALAASGRVLDAHRPELSRDVQAALEAAPALAGGIGDAQGRQALTGAVAVRRRDRLALQGRGREAVRAWDGLEQAYEAAGKDHAWDAQREAGTRMAAFAQALKEDGPLDGVLRERGRALGIAAGSRLDQLVQASEIDWRLLRSIDLEQGPRPSQGMSMGM